MWFENLPAVEVARRLRQSPLFGSASVDELFRIAGLGRQTRLEAGRLLFEEGDPAAEIFLIVEGKVALETRGSERREVGPGSLLGFQEVLAGTAHPETARASAGAISVSIAADDFRTLLADNIELAQGIFRVILEGRSGSSLPAVIHRTVRTQAPGAAADLKGVQVGLLLQDIPIFRRTTPEELLELASLTRPIPLSAGAKLFSESDAACLLLILSGAVRLSSNGGAEPQEAGPGDAVGVYQVLCGGTSGRAAEVIRDGRALVMETEGLANLLAGNSDLLQAIFSAVFEAEGGERQ